MSKKDESTLELAMPVLVKASDHFLRIWKKKSLILNLEVGKESALTIVEEEAPAPTPGNPSERRKKCQVTESGNNYPARP